MREEHVVEFEKVPSQVRTVVHVTPKAMPNMQASLIYSNDLQMKCLKHTPVGEYVIHLLEKIYKLVIGSVMFTISVFGMFQGRTIYVHAFL